MNTRRRAPSPEASELITCIPRLISIREPTQDQVRQSQERSGQPVSGVTRVVPAVTVGKGQRHSPTGDVVGLPKPTVSQTALTHVLTWGDIRCFLISPA